MKKRRRKGETLVETIVSFGIIMIMLALVGTVIVASINMTARAALVTGRLEEAAKSVEEDGGSVEGGARMIVSRVAEGGVIMPNPVYINVEIKQSADDEHMLRYFVAAAQPGGEGGG